jgi:hypothetical protein
VAACISSFVLYVVYVALMYFILGGLCTRYVPMYLLYSSDLALRCYEACNDKPIDTIIEQKNSMLIIIEALQTSHMRTTTTRYL